MREMVVASAKILPKVDWLKSTLSGDPASDSTSSLTASDATPRKRSFVARDLAYDTVRGSTYCFSTARLAKGAGHSTTR